MSTSAYPSNSFYSKKSRPTSEKSTSRLDVTPSRKNISGEDRSRSGSRPTRYLPGVGLEELADDVSLEAFEDFEFSETDILGSSSGEDMPTSRSFLSNARQKSQPSRSQDPHLLPENLESQSASLGSAVPLYNMTNITPTCARLPLPASRANPTIYPEFDNLMSMMQNQQALLSEVLTSQRAMQSRQTQIETDMTKFRTELSKLSSQPLSSPSSADGKRKRVVTRTLSRKIYTLHARMEVQFNASEMFSSACNKSVQSEIVREILNQQDSKFEEKEIRLAARRCYENVRRTFLEQQDGKEGKQSQRRKYRSRRERFISKNDFLQRFQRRSSVVTPKELDKYWQFLNPAYVTEESDDPENPNGIIEHKLEWRSDKLNSFMHCLDVRFAQKNTTCPAGTVAKKVRKVGEASITAPPTNAPVWAIKKNSTEGIINKENVPSEVNVGKES